MFVIGLRQDQVPVNCRDGVTRHKPQLRTRNEGSYLLLLAQVTPALVRGVEVKATFLDSTR
jgi:hypothetical protein